MYKILAGVSVAALLGLAALTVPASAATPTHDQSAANANVTTDMSARHRRYYRRHFAYYGYRRYYGAPYYAYSPYPYYYSPSYYYGPRYYSPGLTIGFGLGW